ncbi:MAG: pyridoxal phosphate-dependent aminotransferase, partial [Pyrinomonadaceae bacterium]
RPPLAIIEPVQEALKNRFTGYAPSAGLLEAREAVARWATALGASTSPDEVVVTSGASEAAELALTALLNNEEEVLVPAPGYPLYTAIINKLGAYPRPYRLNPEHGWECSVDEVRSQVNNKTRAIVLINPNNPTGSVTSDKTTSALLDLAVEHNLVVISDEVYRDLCFNKAPTSASVMAQEIPVPVITLESLSKTHMVPGWRVGWMRYTNTRGMSDVTKGITKLASGRLCSPTPTQYAIQPALEASKDFVHNFIEQLRTRRDYITDRIKRIPTLSCDIPAAAFYLMVKVNGLGKKTDEQFALDLLEKTGVLVVHGSGFGLNPFDGYFRLVYLADEQLLEKTFDAIADFIGVSIKDCGER